ncbi:MAG: hypothetical protein JF612_04525, partial [Planctomycetia bacterium]|nr:hypothetical protein [Planctomycetia bacterium]
MSQLGFEPIFDSYIAVGLIALVLLALLAIRPQFGSLTPRRKLTLTALRLAIVLLAVAALLRPTLIRTVRNPRPSSFVVLLDTSRSMNLPSGRSEQRRWESQLTALQYVRAELDRLASTSQVRVYGYDQKIRPLEVSGGRIKFPDAATGEQTDIGTSLAEALKAEQGKQLAGVLLLGDGTQTAFEPQVENQEAARKLHDEFAAPLYTVTFGLAGDAAQARDIAVERLDEQFTVFVKNELMVRGVIRVRGYAKQDLPVELLLTDDKNQTQTIGRRTVRANEDNRQVEVEFAYAPQAPGHYRLTLKAEKQPDEQVEKNNQLDAFLTVLEGGLRVLYMFGNLPFEQKFIRRAINASPDIELDDYFIDSRTRQKWPINLGSAQALNKYDAFILGDIDAAALGPANEMLIAAAIDKGKGLLMLGGNSSFGRGHYRGTRIADALPIVINQIEGLSGDPNSAAVWSRLPPLKWANKFSGVKQAPGVRVLLESSQGDPLLVTGEYGGGRTLAFAGASTYLWPMHGFSREHNRFWRQIILWLVRQDDRNRDDVWIKLDQRRINPGSRMTIHAGARTAAGDPLETARLETVLVHPGGRREPLTLSRDNADFRGTLQPTEAGDYAIET